MIDEPERLGSLMEYQVECGHWMVCYSLEPTPKVCPDCSDTSRKVLDDMVGWGDIDLDDVPSNADGDLDEWLDESGVFDLEIRKDIHRFCALVDDARATLEHASSEGRKMVAKYPAAERLTMPESAQ